MEKDHSPTPSSQFDDDDYSSEKIKDEPLDLEALLSFQKGQSSALDGVNYLFGKPLPSRTGPGHQFHNAVFELIIPYAKYLGNKTTKRQYYDLIQQEVVKRYPEFRSPKLRVNIQASWSRYKLLAEKKYFDKAPLNKRDRMILEALGHPLDDPDPRRPSPTPPKSPAYKNTLSAAICEAIEPFVTKMKFGRDEETDRLWGVVVEKVVEQFPELRAERKLKRRIQNLFRNIRSRALRKKATGKVLTDHQEISCKFGGEGAEQNQIEFDLEDPLDDDPLEEDEISYSNSPRTETIKVSSESLRYSGFSKYQAMSNVQDEELEENSANRMDTDALNRIQMSLNALMESAKASAEASGVLEREESEETQDEPGSSSSLEPESRADTASLMETNGSHNTKSLPLSQWLKVVDFCRRTKQDFFVDDNHLVFIDRRCREEVLRVPMDRVCPE